MIDTRNKNLYNKRIFGRDITNIEKRNKNCSTVEKSTQDNTFELRIKSKSLSIKPLQTKDTVLQYEKEIFAHMINIGKLQVQEKYTFIHQDMRYVLIDWLIQVHESFQLKDQTLYLALSYLNQFTNKYEITKYEYQLVGITCLWIASKYQEIYPPKINTYVDVTDNSYTLQEIKDMQGKILQILNFNLTFTTTFNILQAIADKWEKQRNFKKELVLIKQAQKTLCMSKFLLELSQIANLNKVFNIQTLVIATITLADSIFKVKSKIQLIEEYQKPNKETLMKCFKEMVNLLQECQNQKKFNAVIKKYQKQKHHKVGRLKITQK